MFCTPFFTVHLMTQSLLLWGHPASLWTLCE